jgi:chorismate-pyruvate lyase
VDASQWATPDLQELVDLFYDSPEELGEFEEVEADQLPPNYRQLLAHHSHMTVTLEEFHRSMVDVRVLDSITSNSHYSRTIVLHRKSDSRAVQYGIVRLHRSFLEDEVFEEIVEQREPLGRILIRHNVLRQVKLLSLWNVELGPALKSALDRSELEICYGRTALIYCNGLPAVELLEIVVADDDEA